MLYFLTFAIYSIHLKVTLKYKNPEIQVRNLIHKNKLNYKTHKAIEKRIDVINR